MVEDFEDIEVNLDYTADDFAALDCFGRVVDQIWNDYGADPDVTLDRYTYTYDRAGNRESRDNPLHTAFNEDYTYDGLDRLTDADRADTFDQSWGLDGLGNFGTFDDNGASQTRTANGVNEITAITGGWITPAYDAAGNMISGPTPGDEDTRVHYVYDAWNRLVAAYTDDGDGTFEPGTDDDLVATYEYDGAKRRIEKTLADETGVEYYYNQQWQMLEERAVDDEGTPTAINQYVWSARYVDAPVVRFHDANADGDLLDEGDNTRYYTTDANHNVTATIDAATGDVVERYVYTPYGTATAYDDDWANPSAPTTDGPLYCGYFLDAETGLYQVRNRYYHAELSVFVNRDPIGYLADINLYRYCTDDPLSRTDPLGLAGADIRYIDYLVQEYGLSEAGRRALHQALQDLKGPGGLAPRAVAEAEARSIAELGGKFLKAGGTALSVLGIWLTLENTAQAAEIPKDWRDGAGGWERLCTCECRSYQASVTVPSSWAIFDKVKWDREYPASKWVSFGRLNARQCAALEDPPRIISETSVIGFTIYNTSRVRCRFGGVMYGSPKK